MSKPTSESLAAIIITNRILGLYPEESKQCMSELIRRREDDGDLFQFEKYIEEKIKSIEEINNESIDSNGLLSMISSLTSIGLIRRREDESVPFKFENYTE